ncbi:unnamed protein product [Heligmosomoides polygyrus]|uniref:ZT_dimer domain-containing protein n=1 Tax=Heligmosomoides polygyrus TaxID=6339 RepID=A0A183G5Q8_HELPZ|nr:unnamed protein product [Heligmosomoides polygyrus]
MSTVPEHDESARKIILPESYSYNGANGPPPTANRRPLDDVTAPHSSLANGYAEPAADPAGNSSTYFDLLDNEEEERLLGDSKPLPFIERRLSAAGSPKGARHVATAPSLRCSSLPKGPGQNSDSPQLCHASSAVTVHVPGSSPGKMQLTQSDLKRPKKEVSQYYKKQNELLENFKNDSEQIQVFQKTRTRQRLVSSTSTEGGEGVSKDDADVLKRNASHATSKLSNDYSCAETTAPLLKSTDGEPDVEMGNNCPPIDIPRHSLNDGEKKPSIGSDVSLFAKHEAALESARATSNAATRLANITLAVNVSLMLAKAVASYLSGSLSILSSLVDSCVDITSGLVISISARMIKKRDPYLYPRGRTRLEPLSLIIISVVMGVASVQLIFGASQRIAAAYQFHVHGECLLRTYF